MRTIWKEIWKVETEISYYLVAAKSGVTVEIKTTKMRTVEIKTTKKRFRVCYGKGVRNHHLLLAET